MSARSRMRRPSRRDRRSASEAIGRLAYLCRAGLSTSEALQIGADCGGPSARVLARVSQLVRRGLSLERALSRCCPVLAAHELAIISAGERCGSLAKALEVLDEQMQRSVCERKRLVSALAYPCFLMTTALAVLCVISVFVLPATTSMYENSGTALPLTTTGLIAFGRTVVTYGPAALILLCVAAAATATARRSNARAREHTDALLLAVPILGGLVRAGTRSSAYRVLAAVLEAGTDMAEALGLVAATIENRALRARFVRVQERVLKGVRPAAALASAAIDPTGIDAGLLRAAEAGGGYAETLRRMSMIAQGEYQETLSALSKAAEPAAVIAMAVAVGFGALGLYQPILGSSAILAAG